MEPFVSLMKPNDVARRLAVSRAWVDEAAKSGRIPSIRIGGSDGPLRFVSEDIERWLAEARAGWLPGGAERADGQRAADHDDLALDRSATRPSSHVPRRRRQESLF